jgi:hypothetical protein
MESRDRAHDHRQKEVVDTAKALIEAYKSAFGEHAESIFTATVRIELSTK